MIVLLASYMFFAMLHVPWSKSNGLLAPTRNGQESGTTVLEHLDQTKLRDLLHHRNGKALFINVWATWCQPCVEEFPDIVRLSNELHDKNIDFVGVSGDDTEDETSKVMPFIKKEKAEFKFFIAKLDGEDEFINTFATQWGGGIPATFTYDRKGRLQAMLVGKQSYEKLKSAAEKALNH